MPVKGMYRSLHVAAGLFFISAPALHAAPPGENCFRYRISVTVATPEGDRQGSSVWEECMPKADLLLPGWKKKIPGYRELRRGEAVAIDLGKRGYLFALLLGPNGSPWVHQIVYWMFPYQGNDYTDEARMRYYTSLREGKAELPKGNYPMFIRFSDLNDPKSAELVYGYRKGGENFLTRDKPEENNVEKLFGQGVFIKKATIEMTSDDVEFRLHHILKWLSGTNEALGEENPVYYNSLMKHDFQIGIDGPVQLD